MSHTSRGHVKFDDSCPEEFKELVEETLRTSDFIDTEVIEDDQTAIFEVGNRSQNVCRNGERSDGTNAEVDDD